MTCDHNVTIRALLEDAGIRRAIETDARGWAAVVEVHEKGAAAMRDPVLRDAALGRAAEACKWRDLYRALLALASQKARCTCDDFCDEPCLQHARENELQNEVLKLRAMLDAAKAGT